MRSLPRQLVCVIALCTALGVTTVHAQNWCQPRTDASGRECYVAPSGHDTNPGTVARPFRTIAKGVSILQAGDVLTLRHGVYIETVVIRGKHGTPTQPILIRSYPGEHAYIDGSVSPFRQMPNTDWEPASRYDPDAHPEEYVSVATFTDFIRGAFRDRNPYTQLIKYSQLADLRATNETFEPITESDDPRPGPEVVTCATPGQCVPAGFRFPWVYMGPGLWIDPAVSATNPQKVHIRLSHTHNHLPGLADYTGEVDPRRVPLAITLKALTTLHVEASSHLRFEHLTLLYGGNATAQLAGTNLVFDHVRFWASTYGVSLGPTTNLTFSHCQFNGGMPSWYFRSDRKEEYTFLQAGLPVLNNLGKQTVNSLIAPSSSPHTGMTIHHCEFQNAHDLYLGGSNIDFHHNWIHNLNDEGLVLDAFLSTNVRIHENVILKTLSPLSFAGATVGGPFSIYRNLIDVRAPTAGYRPRHPGDVDVWRYGNTFKSNGVDGPYALFQNTLLVYAQEGQASYLHYRDLGGAHPRRSFNNIFVAVNPDAAADTTLTFLPSPAFPGPTDGNLYHRMGATTGPLFRYLDYTFQGAAVRGAFVDSLAALHASAFFQQTQSQYAPGYEAHSREDDPQFHRLGADGHFRTTDDLRLRSTSPARAAGILLPPDLLALDRQVVAPHGGAPDMGCYPYGSGPLTVGVDGQRRYPTVP
jgi:hypothetical protein